MRRYKVHKRILNFKKPAGTSRGILTEKPAWYIDIREGDHRGIGECSLLPGLSYDDSPDLENVMHSALERWQNDEPLPDLQKWPSVRFGMETTLLSLRADDPHVLFPSAFTRGESGIPINGLIWMGTPREMSDQVQSKIEAGFTCIKMKIGAVDFEEELSILRMIRKEFSSDQISLRVDANGAFAPKEAGEKLKRLSDYDIHSIEQPIEAGQWDEMARLCETTPIPIALDEELIGVWPRADRKKMLDTIKPQAIILKPGLIGGFESSDEWIELATENGVSSWITSALESNVGLSAIAQYTFLKKPEIAQGLGTGSLYTNNVEGPLHVGSGMLNYRPELEWENPFEP